MPGFGSWGKYDTVGSFWPLPQSPVTEAFNKNTLEIKASTLRRPGLKPVSANKSLGDLGLFPAPHSVPKCPMGGSPSWMGPNKLSKTPKEFLVL